MRLGVLTFHLLLKNQTARTNWGLAPLIARSKCHQLSTVSFSGYAAHADVGSDSEIWPMLCTDNEVSILVDGQMYTSICFQHQLLYIQ